MKRKLLLCLAVALAMALILPAQALAWNWTRVGGDPLKKGGVRNTWQYSKFMTGSWKAKKAVLYAARRNGQPSWIAQAAVEAVKAGDIHTGTIRYKTRVGAMSFGNPVRVIGNTRYMRRGKSLKCFYTHATRHWTEQVSGGWWEVTETYTVWTAKECANMFIKGHTLTRIWHPNPPVEHSLSVTGSFRYVVCLDPEVGQGELTANVTGHSDGDAVTFLWNVNGDQFSTSDTTIPFPFRYGTTYNVTITVRDAAGHTASSTLAPIYLAGPGTPPPPTP